VGGNYLIQHSAGSGKSNTIGWTAHQAINLHDETDQPIFNTAIIVTDRIVLDRQLQDTVSQFEQTRGVVRKIDGTSRQLKDAIERGARIIVTTIQKFSTDHLKEDFEARESKIRRHRRRGARESVGAKRSGNDRHAHSRGDEQR
jgi:type I restriction enzyme, R subunit